MQGRWWIEPRSLERPCWITFIGKHLNTLPPAASYPRSPYFDPSFFRRVAQIHHLGIHLNIVDLPLPLQYLTAAQKFAEIHEDLDAATDISHSIQDLQSIYKDNISNQDDARVKLDLTLDSLRFQHTGLEEAAEVDTVMQIQ